MAGKRDNVVKPEKPYAGFPLTANGNGQWSKKIRKQVHYFGVWAEPIKALEKYLTKKPFLEAGEEPPEQIFTVADLVAVFLDDKKTHIRTGELKSSTLRDYKAICEAIHKRFGRREVASLKRQDYTDIRALLADGYSKRSLAQRLTIARMLFKYGKVETTGLQAPAKRLIRQERKVRLFTAGQVKHMIDNATGELRDMVLLGINCAFGPHDCLTLTPNKVNCEWITHARPKTGIDRRCPLWPETRPTLPFTLRRNDIAEQFRDLVDDFYEPNVTTFYTLRRTFSSIASASNTPQHVINSLMGHSDDSIAGIYRQTIFDQQLKDCVMFVRSWVFGEITLD